MKKIHRSRVILFAVGTLLLPAQGLAQPQTAPDASCPVGYDPFETVCLSSTTGDVVHRVRLSAATAPPVTPGTHEPYRPNPVPERAAPR